MKNIYLEKIEFNKIIDILSSFAITSIGKKRCMDIYPLNNKEKIEKSLAETTEALSLIYRKGNAPIYELHNIDSHILNLKNQNSLSIKSLLEITSLLTNAKQLKKYYFDESLNQSNILDNYFNNLYTNERIENLILASIIDENTIDDRASNELYKIRLQIKDVQKNIKNKLQSMLNSKYIQEPVITLRQNRFVLPIKAEYKSEVKGFVHDVSSSGSTIFIEPLSIFEYNNQISNLKNDENIEIEKILQKLSSLFFEITSELENNYNLLGLIDFIFAKAKYSKQSECNCPNINSDKIISLVNATHPLIDKSVAVPINLTIGNTYSVLLITGPNTGGKTVTLKTVGLLTAMALSGMHIPASSKSSIGIFDNIFADIGDNQNILESLSTFSSHIKNIVNILNSATSRSLVLLDELGSGTDPIEGANLALSILEELKNSKIITIATTHYNELKQYALINDGIENASCEFDIEALSPTYKLLMGVPGKSNAFAISQKLGLDEKIIQRAKSNVGKDTAKIEDLLKEIYDSKSKIEFEKEKIINQSNEITELKKKLAIEYDDLNNNKKSYIQKAKQEARKILLEAKQDANEIIKEIENEKNNSKNINKLRNKLNNKIASLNEFHEDEDDRIEQIPIQNIKPGIEVFVKSFNKNGTVLSFPNQSKKVNVQIDNVKTSVSIDLLAESKKDNNSQKNIIKSSHKAFVPKKVETEINVIGMNVEESIVLVDKFLDNAKLAKLEYVRIVHGKGTGVLGKGIQKFLKNHPHVKSFRYGSFGEGEMGVTVVEIKM